MQSAWSAHDCPGQVAPQTQPETEPLAWHALSWAHQWQANDAPVQLAQSAWAAHAVATVGVRVGAAVVGVRVAGEGGVGAAVEGAAVGPHVAPVTQPWMDPYGWHCPSGQK